jgi:hypothetical protein
MNTLPATEIKRRGVAAIDEGIKKGPVHIIKNNHLKYVVLREEDYAKLLEQSSINSSTVSLSEMLKNRPWEGKSKKMAIKKQVKKERKSWEK